MRHLSGIFANPVLYENLRNIMYISRFQILNYKSYLKTAEIEFKPGFNVVTGKNNAGKTSLLEALTLQFNGNPHRTVETVPYPGAGTPDTSVVRFDLGIDRKELVRLIGDGQQRWLPRPVSGFAWPSGSYDGSPTSTDAFLRWVFGRDEFHIGIQLLAAVQGGKRWCPAVQTLGLYPAEPTNEVNNLRFFLPLRVDSNGQFGSPGPIVQADESNDISVFLAQRLMSQIYRFTAERFNIGECSFGNNGVLTANAQNLPEVLNVLQANTARFQLFNDLVHEILPQIRHVSVRAVPGGQVQVITWPHDPNTMREDVAVPLTQCGSGVGQILAILYVVMTSVHPQVIIIDEPQSFLHPGAVRKLIEVLKRYPQHQYILATHSPTVITAADPQVLLMTQLEDCKTSLSALNVSDNRDLYYSLSDIGASLSDVFGADQILWVEGATEQECFPLILRELLRRPIMGTAVVAIRETGDLEGRDAKRVFQLYNRLSKASVLLPPALGFVLDGECRSSAQKKELSKLSQERAVFLSRRMYENYLLSAAGIAAVANEIDGFRRDKPISEEEVQRLIEAKKQTLDFYCRGTKSIPPDWMQGIDGARVLSEIFSELSETRVTFEKTKHSVAVTKWLIQNDPGSVQEISNLLGGFLSTAEERVRQAQAGDADH
jgi:putative AbiEii toxin of type IV toxin-antitoxin system/AAA ATPase-like protein